MKYTTSRSFAGTGEAAVAAIEAVLFPNGFRLVDSGGGIQRYAGRGMQSTKQNAVRGATGITVRVGGGFLHLDAELGGVRNMAIFVCLFPLVLWGGLSIAPLVIPGGESPGLSMGSVIGAGIWLVIGPLIALLIRRRTVGALDDLLENAAACAARDSRN